MSPEPSTVQLKRKRGRPPGTKNKSRLKDESGPLWAIVDQLTLIHSDLKRLTGLLNFEIKNPPVFL